MAGEGDLIRFQHSVTLDRDKCRGCTNCIKRCPMEAMRVQDRKARVIASHCIDCGECIRGCPYHAVKAKVDVYEDILQYKYTVAIADPALYAQFHHLDDVNLVLAALMQIGFDEVAELYREHRIITALTEQAIEEGTLPKPIISSKCPAVTRLIRVRFADLCDHVMPVMTPGELAAHNMREKICEKTGLGPEDVGIFYISPCAAKATILKMPLGIENSNIDKVHSVSDIYTRLLSPMKRIQDPPRIAEFNCAKYACTGTESKALHGRRAIYADGMENIIRLLEDVEDGKLDDFDFVELRACPGGCVGGVLNVENPYVAKFRARHLSSGDGPLPRPEEIPDSAFWEVPLEYAPVMNLDSNVAVALGKMQELERIVGSLPGLDCGSCGAPSCHALAEDIVRGRAQVTDCIFRRGLRGREGNNEEKGG